MWGQNTDGYSCLFCGNPGDITPSDVSNRFSTGCQCGASFQVERSSGDIVYVEELPAQQVEVYAGTDLKLPARDYESEEDLIEAARKHFEENPDALRIWTSGGGATNVVPSSDETEPVKQEDIDAILDADENKAAVAGARGERGREHVTAALNTLTGRFIQSVEYRVAPRTVRDEIEMRIAKRNEVSSV